MTFGEKLKILRKEKSLTQEDVAKAIFVSRSLIAKYETGLTYPDKESLQKLSLLFGVKVEDLVDSTETTLNVVEMKSFAQKLNNTCLITVAVLSLLLMCLIFIPMFKGRTYVYPFEPEQLQPDVKYFWASIFSATHSNGNFIALITFFTLFVGTVLTVTAFIFKRKRYVPILYLFSYLFLFINLLMFLFSMVACLSYIT